MAESKVVKGVIAFAVGFIILAMLIVLIVKLTSKSNEKYGNVQICVDKNGDYSQPQNGQCPSGSTLQTNYGPSPPKGGVSRYLNSAPYYGQAEWGIQSAGGGGASAYGSEYPVYGGDYGYSGYGYGGNSAYGGGANGPNKFYNNPVEGSYRSGENTSYGTYPDNWNTQSREMTTCSDGTLGRVNSDGSISCQSSDGGYTYVPPGKGQGDYGWDAGLQNF